LEFTKKVVPMPHGIFKPPGVLSRKNESNNQPMWKKKKSHMVGGIKWKQQLARVVLQQAKHQSTYLQKWSWCLLAFGSKRLLSWWHGWWRQVSREYIPGLGHRWYWSHWSMYRKMKQQLTFAKEKESKQNKINNVNLHGGCHPPSDASCHSKRQKQQFTCVTQPPSLSKQL